MFAASGSPFLWLVPMFQHALQTGIVLGVGPPGELRPRCQLAYPCQCQAPPLEWSRIPSSTSSSLSRRGVVDAS